MSKRDYSHMIYVLLSRYLKIVDTYFETIVEDMNRPDFTVSEKYKAEFEELGKNHRQK